MQVSPALLVSSAALLLLQGCCTAVRGWKVLKNGATEVLPEHRENSRGAREEMTPAPNGSSQGNSVDNRAKSGGRAANTVSYSEYPLKDFRHFNYRRISVRYFRQRNVWGDFWANLLRAAASEVREAI